jgi:4,5-dihydroxyphthalate decarboxylase
VSRLSLTLACGDHDITHGLIAGWTSIEGVDLTAFTMPSPERHWRMTRFLEFDICELSMSTYLIAHSRGAPYLAVPVFPHRRFRHAYVFCNPACGVRGPSDLNGVRVGLRSFQTTAGLWARGILQHEYGVDLSSIEWVAQDEEDLPLAPNFRLRLQRAPAGGTVDAMLVRGELGAVIYPDPLPSFRDGQPNVRRLFEDYKAEEVRFYRKTGLFPIMHTVVIKRDLADRHPWLPRSVLKAFDASKRRAYHELWNPGCISMAWVEALAEEQAAVMGPDPWAYGLEPNRKALEAVTRYSFEQGCISVEPAVESLFFESTHAGVPASLS